MSKIGCTCGETIRDTAEGLPYNGYLNPDTTYFNRIDQATADVVAFLSARENGSERQWLSECFTADYSKLQLPLGDIIHDILTNHLFRGQMDVLQCPACHRLLIRRSDEPSRFHGFTPEGALQPDIFAPPMQSEFNAWLDALLNEPIPPEIIGFCFSLTKSAFGPWRIELGSSDTYSATDPDWARRKTFRSASGSPLLSKSTKDETVNDALEYVTRLLRAYLQRKSTGSDILLRARGVAIGLAAGRLQTIISK